MDLLISAATHRSGSTLLQRIFNARRKTLIWGENGGCLTQFYTMYENARYYSRKSKQTRNEYFKRKEDPNRWIAMMTPPQKDVNQAIMQSIRQFHERLYAGEVQATHDMIGYKEVRYGKNELELLRLCYPDCTVILLVRNPVDVWKSVSPKAKVERYGTPSQFAALWNQRVRDYVQLSKKDANMHLVRYEDIVNKDPTTLTLMKRIGHLRDQQIDRVLTHKISSSRRPISKQQELTLRRQCRKGMKTMGYLNE